MCLSQVDHVFKPPLGRKTLKQGKMKGNHVFKPDLDLLEESLVAPRPLSLEVVDSFTIPCNDDGSWRYRESFRTSAFWVSFKIDQRKSLAGCTSVFHGKFVSSTRINSGVISFSSTGVSSGISSSVSGGSPGFCLRCSARKSRCRIKPLKFGWMVPASAIFCPERVGTLAYPRRWPTACSIVLWIASLSIFLIMQYLQPYPTSSVALPFLVFWAKVSQSSFALLSPHIKFLDVQPSSWDGFFNNIWNIPQCDVGHQFGIIHQS